jgi:KRAB domain-containing zinc finger protein
LENALKFIYLGQCDVKDDDVSAFLATGADLGITGLIGEDTEVREEVNPNKTSLPDPEYYQTDLKSEIPSSYHPNRAEYATTEDQPEGEERKRLSVPAVRQADGRFKCDKCDKDYGQQKNLIAHKQAQHEGVRYGCNECDFKATQKGNLTQHILAKHDKVRYSCDQCDYKASQQSGLTIHKQSKHEGVMYSCDQCDHKASIKGDLAKHKRRIHLAIHL